MVDEDWTPTRAEWQEVAQVAGQDDDSARSRGEVGEALRDALVSIGDSLWVGGWMIGSDRVTGASPFKFGNDAAVGLATVAQIGGQLCSGVVTLLNIDNRYGAMALLRQLVEVEYLGWTFAEDYDEAATWLRSDRDERLRMWQPRHLRQRSGDKFRGKDYHLHCELGGHPTPEGRSLLPGHERMSSFWWWYELANHGVSVWEYVTAAAPALGYASSVDEVVNTTDIAAKIARWREADLLREISRFGPGGYEPLPNETPPG